MSALRRHALRLSLALLLVMVAILAQSASHGKTSVPPAYASCSDCTGAWYGGTSNYMNWATQDTWPQTQDNYTGQNACGIENVIALVNYDNQNYGQSVKWNTTTAQNDLESYNRNSLTGSPGGISQWGYATSSYAWPNGSNGTWTYNHPINWWAGKANISTDYGTDPRSIAWMAWNYSLPNHFFHDWIYRQDMEGSAGANLSYQDQVLHATTKLGVALEQTGEIVSVGINGGLHQVIVSGLWSGNDPLQNFPAQIQGLVYRDPEGWTWNSPYSRQEIDYSVWAGGNYGSAEGNPFGNYSLWSMYYGDYYQQGDGSNPYDPEPELGPYAPGPQNGWYHWYHGWNWIRLDPNYQNGQWNPDWSFNAVTGSQMLGA